jgi:hypothetical protein
MKKMPHVIRNLYSDAYVLGCCLFCVAVITAGCAPCLRTTGLFVHEKKMRFVLKSPGDHVRLLRETALALTGDTSGLHADSLYSSARAQWIKAALGEDSTASVPVQTTWPSGGGLPSVSTGSAAFIIAASMLGFAVIGSPELTFGLLAST